MENEKRPSETSKESAQSQVLGDLEVADSIGGMNLEPNDDDSSEVLQRKAVQRAANESGRVQQHLALQRNVNQAMQSGVVQRNVFSDDDGDYASSVGVKTGTSSPKVRTGSSTDSISYTKDGGLPTPWKVLKDIFGEDNLNQSALTMTAHDTLDRPRSVGAEITSKSLSDRSDPITSEIGHLGNDELFIRQGDKTSFYDGGHLIGAKILGPESQEAYDLAPQERNENQSSYNNTIENVARRQGIGSIFQYDVEVGYPRNNFSVDQQTLKDRGILKALDTTQPWIVYIPSRVPGSWRTSAVLTSGGDWKSLDNETKDKSLGRDADVDSKTLSYDDPTKRGAFHFEGDGTSRMDFYSKQYVPADTVEKAKPSTFGTESSLLDPDSYETDLPEKDDIVINLPVITERLKNEALSYVGAMAGHTGHVYWDELRRSETATAFPPSGTLPTSLRNTMEEKVRDLKGNIDHRWTQTHSRLDAINHGTLYRLDYLNKKHTFDYEMAIIMGELNPLANSLIHMKNDLREIGAFGTDNTDPLELDSKSEGALQELWKKGLKFEKRLDQIQGRAANDRMGDLEVLGRRMDLLKGGSGGLQASLNSTVLTSLDTDILANLSDLPRKLIARLTSNRRRSTRVRSFPF